MILRDYQSEAVDFLVPRRRAMIIAPAGSGKTIIGAAALAKVLRPGMKLTWLCNTVEQCAQAGEALSSVPGPQDVDITVCCVAGNPDTSDSDIVLYDESHHIPAATWLEVLNEKAIVWGLTATPWHSDEERNLVVRDVFKEFLTIDRDRILASGHLVEGKVFMHDLDVPGEFNDVLDVKTKIETDLRCRRFWSIPRFEHERRVKWQITQEVVQTNARRNDKIVELANTSADSTLILVHSIEHGEFLAFAVPGAIVVHSKLPKKKRAEAIDGLRSGTLRVLIATSLADEGLNVPRASTLILAAGGRSAGKLEQRAGRVLRPFDGKNCGIIHDFLDRGAQFAHAQAKARMKVYERLGYDPEIVRCIASERAAT